MRDYPDPSSRSPFRRHAILGIAFVLAILSCGKGLTGPLGDAAQYVRGIAFDPIFPAVYQAAGGASSGVVQFTKVHVVLHHSDATIALDTTINFPSGTDSLALALTVRLLNSAPVAGELMTLNLGYINAAGDTVFRGGPISITVAPAPRDGGTNPVVRIPVTYTGPGANAVSVVAAPRTQNAVSGGSFSFTAIAKDAGGNAIAATPIIWNSLDPTIASLTSAAAGSGTAHSVRGTARIVAQLFSGAADTVQLFVTLPASAITIQSGNAQSGVAGANLAQPLVVKVAAVDGLPVAGTTVNFVIATGGGSLSNASAVSDSTGLAQTTWKLGTSVGPQSVVASSGTLINSPLSFTATGDAATATKLVVTTQPANGVAGIALGAVVVTAEDNNGNTATTFNGPVTVAFGTNTASATLGGTTTVNAVAGVASFSTLLVNKNGSAYTLVANAAGLAPATTTPFDIAVGVTSKLAFTVQPSAAIANVVIAPSIVVTAEDSQGNATPTFTGAVTLGFATNPGTATLVGTVAMNAVAGVATFNTIKISVAAAGYSLSAASPGLASATSTLFNIGTGVAASIVVASGGSQTGVPSNPLALPVVISVLDASSNPVAGTTVSFGILTGGGSVAPLSGVSDASGHVPTTWTLGAALGAQTMSATSVGLAGSPLTIGATAAFNAATQLSFTVPPSNATAAVNIAPAIVVTAKDAGGLLAGGFVGNVTLAIGTNPGGSTIGGTVTVAAVAGVATFNAVTLNKSGTGYTLTAASAGLTGATSTTFNVGAGPATTIAVSSGQAQNAVTGTPLPAPIAVLVTDANANPVTGTTVNWGVLTGGGSVTPLSSVTNAAGIATSGWTLGATVGAQTASATSIGLAGSPLTFNATGTLTLANKTWTGATDNQWTTPTNWAPAGPPAATDSVLVPVTGNNPVLAASTTVASLSISTGATLTLTGGAVTLTDNGTLDVNGSVLGGGNFTLGGAPGRTVHGTITAALNFSGTYSLSGTTTVTGNVAVSTAALALNGHTLSLSGNFNTGGSGTVTMVGPLDSLVVAGNVTFGGGSETGLLTNGGIDMKGNFSGGNGAQFNASGAHTTRFSGNGVQTIGWTTPVANTGFSNVFFDHDHDRTFTSDIYIGGTVQIYSSDTTGVVNGAHRVTLGGNNTGVLDQQQQGSGWHVGATNFAIPPANITFLPNLGGVDTTIFSGGGTFTLPFGVTWNSVIADNNTTIKLNGNVLNTQAGSFITQNGGKVDMTTIGDSLRAGLIGTTGGVFFNGGSESGLLTLGAIQVGGSFYQGFDAALNPTGASITSFAPTGTQVSFSSAANVAFHDPGTGAGGSHFWYVETSTGSPIVLKSDVFVDSLFQGGTAGNITWNSDALGTTVRTITAKGVDNPGTSSATMGTVAFRLNDGGLATFFNSIVWNNFPAAYGGALFTLNRSVNTQPSVGFQNYSAVTFSATGQFITNLGALPITLGASNTPATCNGQTLTTGQSCK